MQITVQISPQQVFDTCTYEAIRRKWQISVRSDQYMQLQQSFSLLSFCWPVRLEVICQPAPQGTTVTLNSSNFGFGPIQGNCVTRAAQSFATLLLAAAPIAAPAVMPSAPLQSAPATPQAAPYAQTTTPSAAASRYTPHSIFVAYRRSDSLSMVARIRQGLIAHFGDGVLHLDMDSVPVGTDVRSYLGMGIAQSKVLLAIISPQWLTSIDPRSNRRIADPDDSVRIEIEAALKRGMPIVPVLVDDARLPVASQLPLTLAELSSRNGMVIRLEPEFGEDLAALIRVLEQIVTTR
jgi:hypothetical protein